MKLIPRTKLSESAKAARFQNNWVVCILVTLLLFAIASGLQSVVLVPATVVFLFRDPGFTETVYGGNVADALEKVSTVLEQLPPWYLLLSLFLTFTVILVCLFYTKKIDRRSLASAGFRGAAPMREYLIGFAVGAVMLTAALLLCVAVGAARIEGISAGISWIILPFLAGYLVQGMSEEVLCRGVLMQKLSIRYAPIAAILINAAFFAALHLLNPGLTLLAILNLILFGVFASLYMWKRGNIWGIAALHSAWNFTQGNLFGVEVSGTPLTSSVFSVTMTESGKWINGGSFGLEGGLAGTTVYVIGIVVLLLMPVRRDARLDA